MSSEENNAPQWVETDQWSDVASSLEHLAMSLNLVAEKPQEWKWAIIACHSALQGALICVLSGSNGIGSLTEKSGKALLDWFERSRTDSTIPPPNERVADLPILFERTQDTNYMSEFGGAPLTIEEDTAIDVKHLHNLRNDFIHFKPASWLIEASGLPRIIHSAVQIAQRIMLGHPACTIRLDETQLALFTARFYQVSQSLVALGCPALPAIIPASEHLISQ